MSLLGRLRDWWRRVHEPEQSIRQLDRWQTEQAERLERLAVQRRLMERRRRPDGT